MTEMIGTAMYGSQNFIRFITHDADRFFFRFFKIMISGLCHDTRDRITPAGVNTDKIGLRALLAPLRGELISF